MLAPAVVASLLPHLEASARPRIVPLGGGPHQRLLKVETPARSLLVKVGPAARLPDLEAEAAGLEALRGAAALGVPAVVACGATDAEAFLAIEWLELVPATPRAEERLGEGLAAQHRRTDASFGWWRDNTLGPTPQRNARHASWTEFFREERLAIQLRLAVANGLPDRCRALGERVLERLDRLLEGHAPVPSLLHGDLWGGNWGATRDDTPYVFDPAVYFGDREADIGMTQLFGGFGPVFRRAYEAAWPLEPGAEARMELYNCYHLLNHFNIFGAGYVGSIAAAFERVLARC
ncbi:MAG TPA: fructosamine kinase family protein [Gammaproteobacteria bacterium]